jgi:hypothetical protein
LPTEPRDLERSALAGQAVAGLLDDRRRITAAVEQIQAARERAEPDGVVQEVELTGEAVPSST